jgi:hypothetical protein
LHIRPILAILPVVAVLLGGIPIAFADTGNTLPSTEQILQEANSPQVQSVIAQEAPQAGESQDQATNAVVGLASQCLQNTHTCSQIAGVLYGAVQALLSLL